MPPAGLMLLSDKQHKGLLGLKGWLLLRKDGIVSWPDRRNSGGCGSLNFFLGGGEKGDRWIAGIFDTNSTNQGLTLLTFWSKSGSSHATYKRFYDKNMKQ